MKKEKGINELKTLDLIDAGAPKVSLVFICHTVSFASEFTTHTEISCYKGMIIFSRLVTEKNNTRCTNLKTKCV